MTFVARIGQAVKGAGMMDFVGRAKYDAWAKLSGTAADDAREQYISLVAKLQAQ